MNYKIEMLNISKKFGSLAANDNITLQVKEGEVHGLLGENGAGKSTLMSILFGLYKPDSGVIKIDGKEVSINNPNDANALKIGMVHQHFKLVPTFTVTESIVLGNEPSKFGFLNMKKCEEKIKMLSNLYHLEVNPKAYIKDLTVGMQQRVEILKMLYRDANILIFDEPTAVLTPQEVDQLMKIIKNFKKEGKTIIIITHKLNEIKSVADRCTILRKGKSIETIDVSSTSIQDMAEKMVGHEVHFSVEKKEANIKEKILEVNHLSVFSDTLNKNLVEDVNFYVNRGEILAIAGVEGNGQSELIRAIWGLLPIKKQENRFSLFKTYVRNTFDDRDILTLKEKNKITKELWEKEHEDSQKRCKTALFFKYVLNFFIFKHKTPIKIKYKNTKEKWLKEKDLKPSIIFKGQDITKISIRKKIMSGLSHIPEDRHKYALVLDYSLQENMILNSFYKKEFSKFGWLNKRNIKKYCEELSENFDIRSSNGPKSITRGMSGGNQQKAVLAREISLNPDLLIAVQPTRGLDVGAIEYVHKALIKHRDNDASILLVSYELDEIMNLADRILVMYNGKIVANLLTKDTNKIELGQYMLGAKKDE